MEWTGRAPAPKALFGGFEARGALPCQLGQSAPIDYLEQRFGFAPKRHFEMASGRDAESVMNSRRFMSALNLQGKEMLSSN
jgi:hypothetical protein